MGNFCLMIEQACVAKCKSLRAALKPQRISDGAGHPTGHGGPNDPGTPIAERLNPTARGQICTESSALEKPVEITPKQNSSSLCFVLAIFDIVHLRAWSTLTDSQPFSRRRLKLAVSLFSCHRLEIDALVAITHRCESQYRFFFQWRIPRICAIHVRKHTTIFPRAGTPLIALCASDSTPPPPRDV